MKTDAITASQTLADADGIAVRRAADLAPGTRVASLATGEVFEMAGTVPVELAREGARHEGLAGLPMAWNADGETVVFSARGAVLPLHRHEG